MTENNHTKSVLIIEDEADLREALATMFGYQEFTTYTAVDGEEGIDIALREKPDIVLLDISMPKMDGIAVLTRLRHDPWGKSVPVIVMTSFDDMSKIADVAEQGADYVVKTDITLSGIVDKVLQKLH